MEQLKITWKPIPLKRYISNQKGSLDSTGRQLTKPFRCEYCGCLTVRYDTVEHKALHEDCAENGRIYAFTYKTKSGFSPEEALKLRERIYENRYEPIS